MSDSKQLAYSRAIQDFRHARERAMLEIILDRLQGQPTDLLSYEEARRRLHAHSTSPRGLREIPLDSIIGSVGRYSDFTRSFLPRDQSAEQRWAQVKALAEGMKGFPPIEVYQLGEAYFVRDGHHRVSVARELGAKSIEAYVTEVKSRVSLSPGDDPSQLIVKEEYTEFLEQTELDQIRPQADIVLTEPGKYPLIKTHIDSHHRYLQCQSDELIDYEQASGDWYDRVYSPVIQVIRRQGILREFPGRTESDLYLWVMDHRADLEEHLGWTVGTDQAAADLAEHHSKRPSRRAGKLASWLLRAIIPESLESGPPAGDWRRRVVARRQEEQLFRDILVSVRDDEKSWQAVEQALVLAKRDQSRILGLHVAAGDPTSKNEKLSRLADRFHKRLEGEAVQARFVVDQGEVAPRVCHRARWADLLVLSLNFPPAKARLPRLGSGLRKLIRSCPRPIMLVPGQSVAPSKVLIAFDGSPKSQEALFIATYMASAWQLPTTVITVEEEGVDAPLVQARAEEYLQERRVEAELIRRQGKAAKVILAAADGMSADLILIGGYGATPMLEAVLGSTVDEVLRKTTVPVLVCR